MDETLIYSSEKELDRASDFTVDRYFVYKRPGLDEFLSTCAAWFKMAVWTASSSDYARTVIENIFPNEIQLSFVFTREKCVFKPDTRSIEYTIQTIKPLKKVKRKGFDLEKVIIVDDKSSTFSRNYGNAILVKKYHGEKDDMELSLLLKYLQKIRDIENIRCVEKRGWRHHIEK